MGLGVLLLKVLLLKTCLLAIPHGCDVLRLLLIRRAQQVHVHAHGHTTHASSVCLLHHLLMLLPL